MRDSRERPCFVGKIVNHNWFRMPHLSTLSLIFLTSLALRSQTLEAPVVPDALKVPTGFVLQARGLAVGAQIYTCQESRWILKAPDATLYDGYSQMMAKHFAGPTWMFKDGSRIVATKVAGTDAPNPKSIQWLLLKTSAADGAGALAHTSYIQRVYTAGGIAPAASCSAGAEARSEYTAMYYFWVPAP